MIFWRELYVNELRQPNKLCFIVTYLKEIKFLIKLEANPFTWIIKLTLVLHYIMLFTSLVFCQKNILTRC